MTDLKNDQNNTSQLINLPYSELEDDIEKIFSKHLEQTCNKKLNVKFTNEEIKYNQKELEEFDDLNLIKFNNHFLTDEKELYNINHDEEDEDEDDIFPKEKSENPNYFKKLINETSEGGLYCSYLDSFDKIWISNSIII